MLGSTELRSKQRYRVTELWALLRNAFRKEVLHTLVSLLGLRTAVTLSSPVFRSIKMVLIILITYALTEDALTMFNTYHKPDFAENAISP